VLKISCLERQTKQKGVFMKKKVAKKTKAKTTKKKVSKKK